MKGENKITPTEPGTTCAEGTDLLNICIDEAGFSFYWEVDGGLYYWDGEMLFNPF